MILSSEHASVHASVVVTDCRHRVVLLSMAGPKTAIKAIHASLRSRHARWLRLARESNPRTQAVVCGGLRYQTEVKHLPAVKGVQMIVLARDDQAPAGYVCVPSGGAAGLALARSLGGDPRLVIPVLPSWGGYLLERGREAGASFPEAVEEAPQRLVVPLEVYADADRAAIKAAYAYARDNDGWLDLVDRGLTSGAIALERDLGPGHSSWALSQPGSSGQDQRPGGGDA